MLTLALLALAACAAPSRQPAHRDDGGDVPRVPAEPDEGEGAPRAAGEGDGDDTDAGAGKPGEAGVEVKIEWTGAPAAVRASPGRTPCGSARRPPAVIHALHGVADAIVVIDGVPGASAGDTRAVGLVVRDCRVEPRVAIARTGADVTVASADERRHELTVTRVGDPARLSSPAASDPVGRAALPVIGHEVALAAASVAAPAILRVGVDGDDPGWVVVAPYRYVGVSDDTGAVAWTGVPPGTYRVSAWLPSADARASGEVAVAAGKTATLRLDLGGAKP